MKLPLAKRKFALILIFSLLILSGCNSTEEAPPSYEPPAFTSDSFVVVYRAPDAVPFYYTGNLPEDFESMLEVLYGKIQKGQSNFDNSLFNAWYLERRKHCFDTGALFSGSE